ncbi:pyridoxamine 5'-phosphate oxidase family protein [Parasphingorhabdus sp.]|uniref:pyridoxamine 5'-phosphate oxidase family protein n=1 Tax=Parasphingorhabdus sp. TaxID=2709688 RepID=UPI003BB07549
MNKKQHETINSILTDVNDMTIATVRENGFPQATTVSFVNDDLTIYFGTSADSQKARNIARDGRVSLTVDRPYEDWDDIKSISAAGHATIVTGKTEQEKIGQLIYAKFPQVEDLTMDEQADVAFIRVDLVIISLLDYSKGFGHTELVEA